MSEQCEAGTEHAHIRYCPQCGEKVEPLFETTREGSAEGAVECPNHGEIMVGYYE